MALQTPEARIAAALLDRLGELVLDPPIPVAYPGQVFPPLSPEGKPTDLPPSYIKAQLDNAATSRPFLSATTRHRGSLFLAVCLPIGTSPVVSKETAGLVAQHYPADREDAVDGTKVRILERPTVNDGYRDDANGRWRVPVEVRYEAWTQAS